MAIDTAAKRASVQAYTFGLMRPPPDGTVGTSDRPVIAWLYAGITYGAAPAIVYHLIREWTREWTSTLTREFTRNDT